MKEKMICRGDLFYYDFGDNSGSVQSGERASVMADTEKIIRKKYDVPIWHKSNLTIDEAVEYSGIGRERLRKLTSQEECPFVLHIGNRRMIKRRIFDEYIEKLTFLE